MFSLQERSTSGILELKVYFKAKCASLYKNSREPDII
jgi:hypothetical protein